MLTCQLYMSLRVQQNTGKKSEKYFTQFLHTHTQYVLLFWFEVAIHYSDSVEMVESQRQLSQVELYVVFREHHLEVRVQSSTSSPGIRVKV